jgi:hypothetical protein
MFWSPIPTTDLYFLNSCKDIIRTYPWQRKDKQRKVIRLGDNTFQCGNRVLVIRKDKPKLIKTVLANADIELIYLIDDNIWQAKNDTSLSSDYQARLTAFSDGMASQLISKASKFVVSNENLKQYLPSNKPIYTLDPVWHVSPPSNKHFNVKTNEKIKLVHLGTNSHLAGLAFCIPVITSLLNKYEHVSFDYFSNKPLLGTLDNHPRVTRNKIMRWGKFKRHVLAYKTENKRYHIALYPTINTPMNMSRSTNKIIEIGLVGAVGVYSENWNLSRYIQHGVDGVIINNSAESWSLKLSQLIDNPLALISLYNANINNINRLNNSDKQKQFWLHHLLGIECI